MEDSSLKPLPSTDVASAAPGASDVSASPATPAPRKKGGKKKFVASGKVFIQATYNNTVITVTDPSGAVIAWSSAGKMGFKGPKKSTPYAAGQTVRDVMDKVRDLGFKSAEVFVRGVGSGREAAVRALGAQGLNVSTIKDVTPIPHNGCRPPKVRRV